MTSQRDLTELRACAIAMATAAKEVTLRYFRAPGLVADTKQIDGFDPVTIADREAEAAMRAVLARLRPDDGIIGEELGARAGHSGLTWILDPIDGTRAFIAGAPTWGTLIAVGDETGPILGIIDQPYIGERFEGSALGAHLRAAQGDRDLSVSAVTDLSQAIVLTTFPEVGSPAEARAFHGVARRARLTRYGLDCYGYALLALGHVDLVIEAGLNAYDVAAPIAVIQGAGGIVSDWSGGPAHHGGQIIAAATPALHRAALEILQNEVRQDGR